MKIFIWSYVGGLTSNYHDGGGLMVAAPSLEAARVLMRDNANIPSACGAYHDAPTHAWDLTDDALESTVLSFPDAGCC